MVGFEQCVCPTGTYLDGDFCVTCTTIHTQCLECDIIDNVQVVLKDSKYTIQVVVLICVQTVLDTGIAKNVRLGLDLSTINVNVYKDLTRREDCAKHVITYTKSVSIVVLKQIKEYVIDAMKSIMQQMRLVKSVL